MSESAQRLWWRYKHSTLATLYWRRWNDINVKGLLFTVQKALPLMPDCGSIILNAKIVSNCSSVILEACGRTQEYLNLARSSGEAPMMAWRR